MAMQRKRARRCSKDRANGGDPSGRTCSNCLFAIPPSKGQWLMWMVTRWPPAMSCFNHPDSPGECREVRGTGACRDWRPHRKVSPRQQPPEPPNDKIRYIPLTRGKFAIVDAADYERINRYRWTASPCADGGFYARRSVPGGTVLMHREIMNAPKGMVVNHIDRNRLDNRQANLRVCTPQQNEFNKRPRGGHSRFKGVYPHGDKWQAAIKHNGKMHHLGLFDDDVEAARARDRKAFELQGEFAYLNFPQEINK